MQSAPRRNINHWVPSTNEMCRETDEERSQSGSQEEEEVGRPPRKSVLLSLLHLLGEALLLAPLIVLVEALLSMASIFGGRPGWVLFSKAARGRLEDSMPV